MTLVPGQLSDPFQTRQAQEWIPSNKSDGFRLRFEDASQWLNQAARAIARVLIGSSDPFIWQIDRHYYAQPKSGESTSHQVNSRLIERW